MRNILLFIVFVFICEQSGAQPWTEGMLVKKSGDTIRGLLETERPNKILTEIRFRAKMGAAVQRFTPADISDFQYQDGDLFSSVTFENSSGDSAYMETVFAKCLVSGLTSLYSFYRDRRLFFIVYAGQTPYLLYDNDISGSGNVLEDGNFYAQLTQMSAECTQENLRPDLVNYSEKYFTDFFLRLNKCLYPGVTTTLYYHEAEEKLRILLYGGGMKNETRSNYSGEVLFEFNYPKLSRNFYFVTGILYNYLSERKIHKIANDVSYEFTVNDHVIGIPIALRYNILRSRVEPYLLAGAGAFYIFHSDPDIYTTDLFIRKAINIKFFAGAGIEAHITPWFMARAGWWIGLYSQLPTAGFSLQF
jgi:hypothetical protein